MPERTAWRGDLAAMLAPLQPWRGAFAFAVSAQVLSMGFGLMFPWLTGMLIDAALPSLKPLTGRRPTVNETALLLVLTLVAQGILTYFYSATFHRIGHRVVTALRKALHARLLALPMRFHAEHRVGELSSRLGSDMTLLEDFYCHAIAQSLRQGMLVLGGTVAIFLISPGLAGIMLGSFPVLIGLALLFGRSVRRVSREAQDELAAAGIVVNETLQGIATVKAYGNEALEQGRYGRAMDGFLGAMLRGARLRAALIAFIIVGIFGAIVLVLWSGARAMQVGVLSHGELTQFTLYTLFVGGGVTSIAEIIASVQKARGASQRTRELLSFAVETTTGSGGSKGGQNESFTEEEAPHVGKRDCAIGRSSAAALALEDVLFAYPSRPEVPVLRGLNLEARAGERIALVGPSGAGKSTVMALLLRFYAPDAGRILLAGEDVASLPLNVVRGAMALVPQEVQLFGGTIRENIAYGRPGASMEAVRDAARRANCEEFILRFPQGYETLVGERGIQLSGGQQQRIAIARAFLRDPAILLLDEATSALDSESEALVQAALETLLAGRTALIIAHRLATVRNCDRIYVLQQGRVVEQGSHEALMQRSAGVYRRVASMQFADVGGQSGD